MPRTQGSKKSVKSTARSTVVTESARVVSDKHLKDRKEQIARKPLIPLNERQAEYMKEIKDKELVVATGYAGTSKTYIPASMAADAYRVGDTKGIVLCRPNVSGSASLGFFSGDVDQKLVNWLMPLISVLKERLGSAVYEMAVKNKDIEMVPLETIKGRSFRDVWILIDEAEDLTFEEIKCVTTRAGEGCKMILSGDIDQEDLKGSGLEEFYNMVDNNERLQRRVGRVCFDSDEHIVRGGLTKDLIVAFNKVKKSKYQK